MNGCHVFLFHINVCETRVTLVTGNPSPNMNSFYVGFQISLSAEHLTTGVAGEGGLLQGWLLQVQGLLVLEVLPLPGLLL